MVTNKDYQIRVTHPKTFETKTIKEWSESLGVQYNTLLQRYNQIKAGNKDVMNFFKSVTKKSYVRPANSYKPLLNIQKDLVFRPDVTIGGQVVAYAAYSTTDLDNPILDSIVPVGDGWGWNCYDIGIYPNKKELVRNFIVRSIQPSLGLEN